MAKTSQDTSSTPNSPQRPPRPEPPPYQPDDNLIGYIERGQKPDGTERTR